MPNEPAPYRFGIDDAGADRDGPAGGENALPADANDPNPEDPAASDGSFRRAVIVLLAEIRDALLYADAP